MIGSEWPQLKSRAERNVSIDNIARIAKGLRVQASKLLEE
jgi:hypothetical protein